MAKRRRFGRARRYYGRASGYSRRHPKLTIPIAQVAGIASMPALQKAAGEVMVGNWPLALKYIGEIGGMDAHTNQFSLNTILDNAKPVLAGFLVHKGASILGVNRALAKAGVPFLRM